MSRRIRRSAEFADRFESGGTWGAFAPQPRVLPHLVVILAVSGGSLAAVHYFGDSRSLEKLLQQLVAPVGCGWVLLTLAWYAAVVGRNRLLSCLCGLAWLLLSLAGNSWVAHELIRSLERPYQAVDPFAGPRFDTVFVLGGGSSVTPTGRPQFSSRGDRLGLAARLIHEDQASRIVVSGVRWNALPGTKSLAEESATLLQQLGVPADRVVVLPLGADTSEEIQAFVEWLRESPPRPTSGPEPDPNSPAAGGSPSPTATGAVGVLTSAWHLRRTLRLAERYGLQVAPVPADFLSGANEAGPGWIVPSAGNLHIAQLALRELLGYWFDQ